MNAFSPNLRRGVIALSLGACLFGTPCRAEGDRGAALDRATRELTFFNFDVAYRLYGDVLDGADGDSETWQEATFGRAVAAQHRTPASPSLISEARAGYEAIAARAPDGRLTPRSVLNLGRIAEIRDYLGDEIDLAAARAHYRQVFETWPDRDIADEAALFYACTHFQNFKAPSEVRQGLDFLEAWIAERDERPGASMIWEVMGQVRYHHLDDAGGAVRCLTRADELGLTDLSSAGVLYWQLAQAAEHRLGDLPTAIRYYQKIITHAPRSGRAFNARLALEALRVGYPAMEITIPEADRFRPAQSEADQKSPARRSGGGAE